MDVSGAYVDFLKFCALAGLFCLVVHQLVLLVFQVEGCVT